MNFPIKLLTVFLVISSGAFAQEHKTRNIIIITLDGFRWKELYEGADKSIISNKKYVSDQQAENLYWTASPSERREKLMPFFWNVISRQGQLYGNRNFKNKVNCVNHHLLSYPGYSEMLVGFPDKQISGNDKVENPNTTVLEFIHGHQSYNNRVAAFATWDAFPYILREEKGDIPVNAGNDLAEGKISKKEKHLNSIQSEVKKRYDSTTFQYAMEYLKRERPRVMFIGFDETDQHAHGGRYDKYLNAAHATDSLIGQLWNWIQSQDDYKDQTTLLITTDHGRGKGKNTWKNHRLMAAGSRHIWFAVLGPDTPAFGEMKFKTKYYQNQVAKTIAAFLGLPYKNKKPVGEVVQTMMAVPQPVNEDVFIGLSKQSGESDNNNK